MLTGELHSQIDAIWNSFWSGGFSNPLEVMEQITYLLFMRLNLPTAKAGGF
jgi:type I restriction enzyme M protein